MPSDKSSTSPLRLPSKTATPEEVRDFLEQVMLHQSSDSERAKRAAANWTLGGGEELRTYPAGMYRDMFDAESSWAIYGYVRRLVLYEELPARTRVQRMYISGLLLSLGALGAGVALLLHIIYWPFSMYNALGYIQLGVWTCVFSIVPIVFLVISLLEFSSPEKQVKEELNKGWAKASSTSGSSSSE